MKKLAQYSDHAYALLRIVSGFLFAFHGAQKIFGIMMPYPKPAFGTQIWLGGMIELVGGLMVMIGLQTRWAAFICSGTMAVAYTQFHWKLQGGSNFFPAVNQGEPAAMYAFIFLYLATRGGVKWATCRES
jgi:putative oxidoreductase